MAMLWTFKTETCLELNQDDILAELLVMWRSALPEEGLRGPGDSRFGKLAQKHGLKQRVQLEWWLRHQNPAHFLTLESICRSSVDSVAACSSSPCILSSTYCAVGSSSLSAYRGISRRCCLIPP
ncbi:hypothetical protein TgHK011_006634 [Trichoderma gracile]|nr:hypothetical protein TgHK011_006634 [Trichoderma gracile]